MEDNAKKSSKRFLVIYCLAIFVFAVALILITYISQTRSAEATDALQNKLTDAQQQALTTQTSLDQLLVEFESLKTTNAELTAENETLTAEKIDIEAKLAASQKLTSLVDMKYNAKKSEFETALNEFELGGYPALLAPDDLELYNSIK